MKTKLSKLLFALALMFAGVIGLGLKNDVFAEKISIKVSPYEFRIDLKQGEAYTDEFTLYNEGDDKMNYKVSVVPYQNETNDKGDLKTSYETRNGYTEMTDWVTFSSETGEIAKGGSERISFTVNVPEDAPGGGQYVVLLATTAGNDEKNVAEDGSVTITQSAGVGPIIYATVEGERRETAEITQNDISGFYFNPPISVTSTVKNTGNIHGEASYITKVYPIFSNESIYNTEEANRSITVLPESTRVHSETWDTADGAPSIGIFRVVSEVRIFDQVSTIEKTIIICPMWILILIAAFIIAVIFWLVSRSRARKSA